MKINFKKFFSNRHKLLRASGLFGMLLGWFAMYFFDDWESPIFWSLICLAVVFGYGGAWGGLSHQWGSSPFTNDPLGWRKAKQSYKEEAAPEEDSEKKTKT
jgi:fatty-acid desaturase